MSEYKYACPVCGQHIKCDSSQAGSVMECPTCFQKIVAPQAPDNPDPKFILTGQKYSEKKITDASARAAAASTTVAPRKSFPLGIVIVFVLVLAVGAGVYAFRKNIFKPAAPSRTGVSSGVGAPAVSAGGNMALNRPAFASSQQPGNPAQSGNDGNAQTRWCAASGDVPQWWEVDLGGNVRVTNTQISWEQNAAYKYLIQISPDSSHWTTLVDRSANSTPARMNSDFFSANGRYLKVTVTGLAPGLLASFYELKVLGEH